jgi:hypothetical protein
MILEAILYFASTPNQAIGWRLLILKASEVEAALILDRVHTIFGKLTYSDLLIGTGKLAQGLIILILFVHCSPPKESITLENPTF